MANEFIDQFTQDEFEFIDILYDADFFDIRINRHGDVTSVSYNTDDLYRYFDEEQFEHIDLGCLDRFVKLLERAKFYEGWLELSDSHTWWDIRNVNVDLNVYDDYVNIYVDEFERKTGIGVQLLGRSGRHVCVEDTAYTIMKYDYLCEIQRDLERQLVDEVNSLDPDEDNF